MKKYLIILCGCILLGLCGACGTDRSVNVQPENQEQESKENKDMEAVNAKKVRQLFGGYAKDYKTVSDRDGIMKVEVTAPDINEVAEKLQDVSNPDMGNLYELLAEEDQSNKIGLKTYVFEVSDESEIEAEFLDAVVYDIMSAALQGEAL